MIVEILFIAEVLRPVRPQIFRDHAPAIRRDISSVARQPGLGAAPSVSAATGTGTTITTVTVHSYSRDSNTQLSTIAPQTTVSFAYCVSLPADSGKIRPDASDTNSWD
jgi:hypothetical protein